MHEPPTSEAVRARIAELTDLDRKVLGGLVTLMIAEPARVRDQEWVAERFVQVAVVAHGFDATGPDAATPPAATHEEVAIVESFAKDRMHAIVAAALALFVRTAEDLRARGGNYTFDDARAVILDYVATA